jgi:UDP-N-acetylglucosamine 2-epimerase (non-hydrolysing)
MNSTVAAALVCAKLSVSVAHLEAGLRSFDRTMPEEVNHLVTDQLSDLLFTPSEDGNRNLIREGVAPQRISLVGSVMIDTLIRLLPRALQTVPADLPRPYALLTLHRPSNVDALEVVGPILSTLLDFSGEIEVFFLSTPRTRQRLDEFGLLPSESSNLHLLDPLPCLEFLALQHSAKFVVTDSGSIHEETKFLEIPCLTVGDDTEHPLTVSRGSSTLIGRDMNLLAAEIRKIMASQTKVGGKPVSWHGKAGERIADCLVNRFVPAMVASRS